MNVLSAKSVSHNIDAYIARFPSEVQAILQQIRSIISAMVPEAQEKISYGMPAWTLDGAFIYVGAFNAHLGIYPPVVGDEHLRHDLARYHGAKGNLRFPLNEPMPYDLIMRVIAHRLMEHRD